MWRRATFLGVFHCVSQNFLQEHCHLHVHNLLDLLVVSYTVFVMFDGTKTHGRGAYEKLSKGGCWRKNKRGEGGGRWWNIKLVGWGGGEGWGDTEGGEGGRWWNIEWAHVPMHPFRNKHSFKLFNLKKHRSPGTIQTDGYWRKTLEPKNIFRCWKSQGVSV
jgi:hypothetical protein